MRTITTRGDEGIALILVLGVLAVLATLATTFAFNMRLEQKAARNYLDTTTADSLARSGIEHAIALLRPENDINTYDWYGDSWSTSFRKTTPPYDNFPADLDANAVDNDGDGINDSRWINVLDPEGYLIGAYAIYVVDELGKINVNLAGNTAETGGIHGDNQGWTVAEIDLECLPGIGPTLGQNIVKYRYGGDDPGTDDIDDDNDGENGATPDDDQGIECDGIDNDGDDDVDEDNESIDEPDEYVPFNRFGNNDVEFATIEQIKLVEDIDDDTFWKSTTKTGIKPFITAYAAYCSQDRCYYSSAWQDRVNINAVTSSYALYDALKNSGSTTEELACRYTANIIDYADMDYVPTLYWNYTTNTPYPGIEGLQINEVMCNTNGIWLQNDASYVDQTGSGWVDGAATDTGTEGANGKWSWPFDANGTYTVDIYATDGGSTEGDYTYTIEGVGPNTASGPVTGVNITVGADGDIDLEIKDFNEVVGVEVDSTFDKVVVHAGDFVEVINISELNVDIDSNWKLKYGSTEEHALSSVTLTGHTAGSTTFDYFLITNSLYAMDYIYGDNDGDWADDYGVSFKRIVLKSSPEFLDIADTNEAVGLYSNFGGSTDVLIDIAPYGNGYGTQGYGDVTQNYSSERPSPIDDSAATGNWSDSSNANSVTPADYWCTPGGDNSNASPSSSWHVHDGPYANVGLIKDVAKGTGAADTFQASDLQYFADKLTVTAHRLEAEDAEETADGTDPTPNDWTSVSHVSENNDGTTIYEAPNNTGSWNWAWTDGNEGGDANVRLIDGTYHLFVCADYPDCDFQRPSGTARQVRPNCLAYAGEVTVSGKSFTVAIRADGTDTPRLDYVLLVPKKDSPGRLGCININTATDDSTSGKGVLEGLPGIDNADEGNIVNIGTNYRPFSEIGGLCNASGVNLSTSDLAPISNLITVRSDIFQIICTAVAVRDMNNNDEYDGPATDVRLAEKKIEVIVDRSQLGLGGKIRILSWKEISE